MAWRAAKSILQLQRDLDKLYPGRKKPDGIIGDAAHAARKSDHNPNSAGVVQAIDISEGGGLADRDFADKLLASHDKRIKYIISEGRIGSSYKTEGAMPWTWRPYTGENAHMTHVHVSVVDDPELYDDESPWNLAGDLIPTPLPPPPIDSEIRQQMARKIINYEYKKRPFAIHTTSDGPEIVGIVQKKHPEWYAKVVAHLGNDVALEKAASEFYITYTNQAAQWTDDLGVEHYIRDLIANRGPKGAAIIVQGTLGFQGDDVDGAIGNKTKQALAAMPPAEFLEKVTSVRAAYDKNTYGYGPDHAYYKGLKNRWEAALADAKAFSALETPEPAPVEPPVVVDPPVVVPPVVVPPITPPVIPPDRPHIDFDDLERRHSLEIQKMLTWLLTARKAIDDCYEEIMIKMELNTPADIHKAIRSGKTAGQIAEQREGKKMANEVPETAVVDVVPWYRKRTVLVSIVGFACGAIALVSKNAITVDPQMQAWIVDIALSLMTASSGTAVYTAATSSTVTPTGQAKAAAK